MNEEESMRLRISLCLVFVLFSLTSLWGQEIPVPQPQTVPQPSEKQSFLADRFRLGLVFEQFDIKDSNIGTFYKTTKNIPGIELSIRTFSTLDFYLSATVFKDTGETAILKKGITFKMIPITVGFRYRFKKMKFVEPFVGAGINFYSYKEDNPEFLGNASDSAMGFNIQGGAYFHAHKFILGELFFRYNMVKDTFETQDIDLGGAEFGVGLVFKFL
jgi:hypothetical protein